MTATSHLDFKSIEMHLFLKRTFFPQLHITHSELLFKKKKVPLLEITAEILSSQSSF